MSSNSKYYQISSIVDQFLINNDLSNGWFPKALSWALYALRNIKLDVWQDVKTDLLPVTERKTVVLPDGFVDWCKVAVQSGQYAITLGVNEALTSLDRTAQSKSVLGLLSQQLPNGIDFSNYGGFQFYNYGGSTFFGIGTGLPSKGYFKVVDHGTCKELLMDYDYGIKEVYLEYITDGLEPCAQSVINPYFYDYILKYIEAQYEKKNNPKATQTSIFNAEQDAYFALKDIRARRNNLDPQTLLNITRQQTRLTPHM